MRKIPPVGGFYVRRQLLFRSPEAVKTACMHLHRQIRPRRPFPCAPQLESALPSSQNETAMKPLNFGRVRMVCLLFWAFRGLTVVGLGLSAEAARLRPRAV